MIVPLHRILWSDAAQHVIHGGRCAVDVTVWADQGRTSILFLWSITALDDHRDALRGSHGSGRNTVRRAKVQQFDLSIFCDVNVIRCDIPMDDPLFMHFVQDRQKRYHDLTHLLRAHHTIPFDQRLDRIPFDIFHHQIGSIILFKGMIHGDDGTLFSKQRQPLRLHAKTLPSLFKQFPTILVIDHDPLLMCVSPGQMHRQIFLDRYLLTQKGIPANVGNAKTSIAQHVPNIETIVEQRSGQQLIRLCPAFFRLVTVWTAIQRIRIFFHAMITPHPFIPPLSRVPPLRDKTAADNLLYSETAFPG